MKTMQLDIVSAEASIFKGEVTCIVVDGSQGALGIFPGHTALLSFLKPGQISVKLSDNEERLFYISGGMLEVQPEVVTVLADTAIRAEDLDEAAAVAAKESAEKKLAEHATGIEYSRALSELAEAAAQLRTIERIRKEARH